MCDTLPSWLREAGDSLPSEIPRNPFEIFGLPAAFEISREELDRCYRQISRKLHPDHASLDQKEQAKELSAKINRLVAELKDPVRRAHLLYSHLSQKSLSLADFKPSGAFLMEMFELQDELEELNFPENEERLLELENEMENRRKQALLGLKTAFENHTGSPDLACLESTLKKELSELAYLDRILNRVGEKLDE